MKKIFKVSLIIPCYKVEQYLPKCLDSLLQQTLDGIEIITINDGSPDNCLKILKNYQAKFKKNNELVIIDKPNEGVWKGRLDGIKKSRGEYIGFIDSDDYVEKDYCLKLYNSIIKEKADISICGFKRIDLLSNKVYSQEMCKPKFQNIFVEKNPGILLEINGAPWNKLFKSSILKNMPELKNIPKVLDDMMFLQLAYLNTTKITFINDSLYDYMVRKDSIINTIKPELIPGVYNAMKEIKSYYNNSRPKLLEYLDAVAGLHVGISFMYRLSENKNVDFKKILENNTCFLNDNFPKWMNNKYITKKYIKENKGANSKLRIVMNFYKLGMFPLFLSSYKFFIKHCGVDIKW
jgi:glycosyltransferase involved in cell wall biosynthesis